MDFPRSCVLFLFLWLGVADFFLLLQIGMKSSHKAVISYGVFCSTRGVAFSRDALPELRQLHRKCTDLVCELLDPLWSFGKFVSIGIKGGVTTLRATFSTWRDSLENYLNCDETYDDWDDNCTLFSSCNFEMIKLKFGYGVWWICDELNDNTMEYLEFGFRRRWRYRSVEQREIKKRVLSRRKH